MSFLNTLLGTKDESTDKIIILEKADYASAIRRNDVQLVDVRTPKEYNEGHIPNAVNIDYYNSPEFIKQFKKLDPDKPLFLYCRSGARSLKSARRLIDMGFKKVYDLKGGYLQWG
ncbi:rhodanese-like domain-containing protein [Muriicola sp. Z0-33]|uniref:rhodanese-like domain-containing protein n=1 Tax=Muriicola sp. Z0-33 TaxID=2816957 RepID=UPI002238CA7F|nr:rhodanese-like domain-containing protein [Muriicola sp. Z0-33]MCW5515482.1 rhodanese-like domain-containing protein [Muriicola sp. Z0-33]